MRQRFHREARAAARLRHPHIVAIHEVGEYSGQPFFTMDYIKGRGLEAVLSDGPMRFERGARILRDVARAVHHAHQEGIIHRDLKPANILLDAEDVPHVTDFGLAKDIGSRSMLSVTGEVMGTPSFMSPEQADGRIREVDFRTDVYSIGAILYRMLTGKPPFEGPTIAATLYKVVYEYTTEPVRLNNAVPPELSAICMKALEKEKKDRYRSAGELAEDLDRYLRGEPVTAKPISPWERFRRSLKRQRRLLVATGSVAAVALAAIVAILVLTHKSPLDRIEEHLAIPELRLTALDALLRGLYDFEDRDRAVAMAKQAVMEGTDEATRERIYAHPVPVLASAYATHLTIEEPERLRIRLIRLLASLGYRPVVPKIISLLRTTRGAVRLEAIRFFKVVPDARAFYAIGSLIADTECGSEAREALQRLNIDRVIGLVNPAGVGTTRMLTNLGEAIEQRNREVDRALAEMPRKVPVDPIVAATHELRTGDPARRMQMAWELGRSEDPRARAPLFEALTDSDPAVARMAATGLATLGAAEYKDDLLDYLKHTRSDVRRNAAFLLGKIGDKSVRPALEAAYREEKEQDVRYALVALR
jgi:hypothetical protein